MEKEFGPENARVVAQVAVGALGIAEESGLDQWQQGRLNLSANQCSLD